MYKRTVLALALVLVVATGSGVAYSSEAPTLAPNPEGVATVELPTTPPEWIDDTPITPEEQEEARQAIAALEPQASRERAGIIMSSHRRAVGMPTEWVVAIGVGIATIITIVGISGGRRGQRHK